MLVIMVPVYTRLLSTQEYGAVDILAAAVLLFRLSGTWQLEAALGRFFFLEDVEESTLLSTTSTATFFFACTSSILLLISGFLLDPDFDYITLKTLVVAALILPFSCVFLILSTALCYLKKPWAFGSISLLHVLVTISVSVLLVKEFELDVFGVFLGELIGWMVAASLLVFKCVKDKLLLLKVDVALLKRLLIFSLPLSPGVIAAWGSNYANRWILLAYYSPAEIGIYAAAMKLASLFKLIESGVKLSWGPFFYRELVQKSEKKNIIRIFNVLALLISIMIFAVIVILPFFYESIVTQSYSSGLPIALVLVCTFGFQTIVQVVLVGPTMANKTHLLSLLQISSLILGLITSWLLQFKLGLTGIAIGQMVAACWTMVIGWKLTELVYPIGFSAKGFIPLLPTCIGAMVAVWYYR